MAVARGATVAEPATRGFRRRCKSIRFRGGGFGSANKSLASGVGDVVPPAGPFASEVAVATLDPGVVVTRVASGEIVKTEALIDPFFWTAVGDGLETAVGELETSVAVTARRIGEGTGARDWHARTMTRRTQTVNDCRNARRQVKATFPQALRR